MKLNLGCQVHYFEGWTNTDVISDDPNIKIDIAGDARSLPFENDSADFIYAGHLLEHFYPNETDEVIKEWRRVLKPGGTLVIVTPDCGDVFEQYALGHLKSIKDTWQQIYGRIYNYDTASEKHHIAFDRDLLDESVGKEWTSKSPMDFNNPPEELKPFMGEHISTGAFQLGIVLVK